jgi:glycosyltransferase involved in cell wall biosynthesis
MQKRIAVVSSGHIPSEWAHSMNTMKHAEGFRDGGNHVEVFSVERYQERKKLGQIDSIQSMYDINESIPIRLFRDRSLFYFREAPVMKYLPALIERTPLQFLQRIGDPERRIAEKIFQEKFDWAYCRALRIPAYLIELGVPVVVEWHNPRTQDKGFQEFLKHIDSGAFLGISTIAEQVKKNLLESGIPAEKVIVQEDAVDLKKFDALKESKGVLRKELGLPESKTVITYSGSLHRGKGIHELLRVAERMRDEAGTLFLIVGGPQKIRERYERQARREGLRNVRFAGYIEHRLVPKYLKASDILIMLYDIAEKNPVMDLNTTSPLKLFEYMAAKVPIIASDIPALERVVAHGKEVFFVPSGDYSAVADAVKQIVQNKNLRDTLVQTAYETVQKHTYMIRCRNISAFANTI